MKRNMKRVVVAGLAAVVVLATSVMYANQASAAPKIAGAWRADVAVTQHKEIGGWMVNVVANGKCAYDKSRDTVKAKNVRVDVLDLKLTSPRDTRLSHTWVLKGETRIGSSQLKLATGVRNVNLGFGKDSTPKGTPFTGRILCKFQYQNQAGKWSKPVTMAQTATIRLK